MLLVEGTSEEALINAMQRDGAIRLPFGTFVLECLGKFNMPRLMFLLDKFAIRHFVLLDKDEKEQHRLWNQFVEKRKTPFTLGMSYFEPDLERSLGLPRFTGDKWRKPQDLLMKYKANSIPRIDDFRKKVESLVRGDAPAKC